jgi:hypothetical protein
MRWERQRFWWRLISKAKRPWNCRAALHMLLMVIPKKILGLVCGECGEARTISRWQERGVESTGICGKTLCIVFLWSCLQRNRGVRVVGMNTLVGWGVRCCCSIIGPIWWWFSFCGGAVCFFHGFWWCGITTKDDSELVLWWWIALHVAASPVFVEFLVVNEAFVVL